MPLAAPPTGPPSLKKPDAVIFDMDGVLFDTERFYQEAALTVGKDMGCAIPASLLERVVGLSWPGTRALFVEAFGPSFPVDEFIAAWLCRFEELAAARHSLKPGASELIRTLEQFAIPRAIATGSTRERRAAPGGAFVSQLLPRNCGTWRLRDWQTSPRPVFEGGRAPGRRPSAVRRY